MLAGVGVVFGVVVGCVVVRGCVVGVVAWCGVGCLGLCVV